MPEIVVLVLTDSFRIWRSEDGLVLPTQVDGIIPTIHEWDALDDKVRASITRLHSAESDIGQVRFKTPTAPQRRARRPKVGAA